MLSSRYKKSLHNAIIIYFSNYFNIIKKDEGWSQRINFGLMTPILIFRVSSSLPQSGTKTDTNSLVTEQLNNCIIRSQLRLYKSYCLSHMQIFNQPGKMSYHSTSQPAYESSSVSYYILLAD